GFTGTPIDKDFKRSTMLRFGPLIDAYTIPQAVEDGATVPIYYEARLPELSIEGPDALDRVFDAMFRDRPEHERARIRRRYTTSADDEALFDDARAVPQKQVVEAFKKVDGEPEVLVVVDMLLTGFDAPVEQVLYLDRGLREHGLLQAIARVNRRCTVAGPYGP